MTSSPFYDIYIYLPNSPNRHNDPILSSINGPRWVSSVEAQGWGIAPIWFGLQSTCVNSTTGISQYISNTPSTASTQGAAQADSAVTQDTLLGIIGGIIYLNIENYQTGGACSAAMQAYVDGFVSEIGVYKGYNAGVYANPAPINSDISQVSPAPGAIWIANANNQVAIWNQGIPDYMSTNSSMFWPNGQRMHQFIIDPTGAINATWGGTGLGIDYDIDNGPVVNANQGVKIASSYTYNSVSYPGAAVTFLYAINDVWDASLINGPGLVGQIVGEWDDTAGNEHGFLSDGLVGYTTIDFPAATFGTAAIGVNNVGQIVGAWANSTLHGFLLSNGTCTSIDYPGAQGTVATGINDAGQIVGYYYGGEDESGQSGFLYYGSNFYQVNYPGALSTAAWGINGGGTIIGSYSDQNNNTYAFVEYAQPPNWSGTYTTIVSQDAYGYGINNNSQETGALVTSAQTEGFLLSNGVLITLFPYMGGDTVAYSTNDFEQTLGSDFLAVPQ